MLGNDGEFKNEKNEASKSVNGNNFDKIIDIPAVNNNDTSKEESKGDYYRVKSSEHRARGG